MKLQSGIYQTNVEVRTSTSIIPLEVCYKIHYLTRTNLYFYTNNYILTCDCVSWVGSSLSS